MRLFGVLVVSLVTIASLSFAHITSPTVSATVSDQTGVSCQALRSSVARPIQLGAKLLF
jgi:hypothetical protein